MLSAANILWLTTAFVVAWFIYKPVYNTFFHPLCNIPGPILWCSFDLPFIRSKLAGTAHKELLQLHQKYGAVVRVAPNEVAHSNGAVWRDVWGHNKDPEFGKSIFNVPYNGSHGILSANRIDHRRFRHLLSNSFSASSMAIQESRIQHYINLFMTQLSKQSSNGPQDMVSWFNWTTFDIISDLSFGESLGCLENVRTHEWVKSLLTLVQSIEWSTTAKAYGLLPILMYITPKSIRDGRARAYQYYHEKIAKRVKYGKDRGDFLDPILQHPLMTKEEAEHTTPGLKKGMTIEELESNASNLVLAGSETTATLLSGVTFHLLRNPRVLYKLTTQIRETFSSPDAITMTAATTEVPYLLHVLNETLRIYNPVPVSTGRQVPDQPAGGATVDGRFYPSGTKIVLSAYSAYRLEANFARPSDFVPERWLPIAATSTTTTTTSPATRAATAREQSEKETQAETRPHEFDHDNADNVFQPFSVGPRNCIGRNLAYAEMRVILAKLLWWFDLAVPSPASGKGGPEWERWADEQKSFTLWEKGPLWVDVTVRKDRV